MLQGAIIGFAGVAVLDITLQWIDHLRKNRPFTWESFNCTRTLKNALIGTAVGAGVGYLAYENIILKESESLFDSDDFLKKILSAESIKSNHTLFNKYLSYKTDVKQLLNEKFGQKLVCAPEDTGSFFKRTAVISNCDLDVMLPFKKDSYTTLEEMYYDVYDTLHKNFGNKAIVSKQTKAIGLTFEYNGLPIHFDIVPGREINNYKSTKEVNLYVRPDLVWQKGSSFKTNIGLQKKVTTNLPAARRIIKLLKTYREKNNLTIPSVLIEHCVCDALSGNRYGTSFSDTENLLNSMMHIANKLDQNCIVDTANSNNNLLEKISYDEKLSCSTQLKKDIKRIENSSRYIKEIF